jgi:hypothetical protein
MHIIMSKWSLLFLLAMAILASACSPAPDVAPGQDKAMPITLRLGDPQQSHLGRGAGQDKHPLGLIWHEHDWRRGNLGVVTFEHGQHSFTLENVLSVTGTENTRVSPTEGIRAWTINFGVSAEQADTHEAARERVIALLAMLRAAGWQRYIFASEPRLTGKQAWHYANRYTIYSHDSTYEPTLDEWKETLIHMPAWYFFADGVYLKFDVNEMNWGKFPGKTTYLLSISIESEFSFYGIGYAGGDPEKIANWKSLVPAAIERDHLRRTRDEAALQAEGYTIDTRYQDPPIKALQGK